MAYKDPEMKKAKDHEYHQENRRYWKAKGRCGSCGKMDAYTLAGRATCAECLEAANTAMHKYYANHKVEMRAKQRARYEAKKAAGLCVKCGRPLKTDDAPHVTCAFCRATGRLNRTSRASEDTPTHDDLVRDRICTRCWREPAADIELRWSDRKTKLCEACYDFVLGSASKARAAFAEKHGTTWDDLAWCYEKKRRIGGEADGRKADA